MIKQFATVFAGALLLAIAGSSAFAQEGTTPVAAPAPAEAPVETDLGDETIECRILPPKVGTRIPGKRACLTRAQWAHSAVLTKETGEDINARGLIKNAQ
ncbi:hypothetical protein [Qipengyuania marisflavi]|uniref:Porin n=1 Tax=Qipengyuania marisflavi TaxID=2486356 RepID=A0A5S3Q0G1_9SPHN|nr:hypothetical protein [Qipengyuania marisflavi]TMM49817.1 hypothetical protein FEV51_01045 [Qipengyuania marisflavi]